jgi:hypothetical protein
VKGRGNAETDNLQCLRRSLWWRGRLGIGIPRHQGEKAVCGLERGLRDEMEGVTVSELARAQLSY